MSALNYEPQLFIRYLNLLGVPKREPSIDALKEIVRAQLFKVPFENISKLYYLKHRGLHHLIEFKDYLNGIEHYRFGGTCYSNNYYMNQLLTYLGYDVKLCGADMKNPDVHIVNIVSFK
jgi:arylamine N-acetyltransferase